MTAAAATLARPAPKPAAEPPLLEIDDVTVEYDGFKALNGLKLRVPAGGLTVVIGPNGAGKSTMCDVVIGRVRPTSGRIRLRGADISELQEHRIVAEGICRKFQTPGVLQSLGVFDNLLLAAARDRRWFRSFNLSPPSEEIARAEEILALVGLEHQRKALAGELSHGEKQWLEIGMVVATGCELLLLDEPTAGMGAQESTRTAEIIRGLVGRHSVLVIDHDIDFVEQLGGHVVVMHQGQVFREGALADIRNDEDVASIYLGRPGK
jgi:urea transport system ATP-binding protein